MLLVEDIPLVKRLWHLILPQHMIQIMSKELLHIFANARLTRFGANEALFHTGQPVAAMHLVTEGRVEMVRHSRQGARMVLFRAMPDQIIAEASAYSQTYHCDGIAIGPAAVRSVPVTAFRAALAREPALADAWAGLLARNLQKARIHAEIRGLRSVAERLDAWLSDRPMPPKGEWQNLAQTLGVSREALYRELSRRRAP